MRGPDVHPVTVVAAPPAAPEVAAGGSNTPLLVVVLLVSAGTFGIPAMLPAVTDTLALPAAAIGLVWAMVGAGRVVVDLPAGRAADRWPAARSLGVAGAVLTVGAVVMITASTLPVLLVGAALIGGASALTNTVCMTAFARRAPTGQRGRAMATYSTAVLTGQTVGPGLAGAVTEVWGWTVALTALGAVGGAATAAAATFTSPTHPPQPPPALQRVTAQAPPRMRGVVLVALLSVPTATFFALSGLVMGLVPLLGVQLGWTAAAIGGALLLGGGSRLAGARVAGRGADRRGRKVVLLPSLAVMAAGAALLAVPATVAWLGAVVLLSVGSQGIAVASAVVGDVAPPGTTGRYLGWYRLAGDVGLLAGPAVSVWLATQFGLWVAVAPSVVVLLASAVAVLVVVPETHRGLGRYAPRHVRARRGRQRWPRHLAGELAAPLPDAPVVLGASGGLARTPVQPIGLQRVADRVARVVVRDLFFRR